MVRYPADVASGEEERFLVQHQVFQRGRDANWAKRFANFDQARAAADERWDGLVVATRQVISDLYTRQEWVRRSDGSWVQLGGAEAG